ncbi:hypothetical protein RJ639_017190 [Escallonia herrerae]|uniref:Uncharacterized protein n=1 Tax=Escallonia herrerae TaxID=1293975 RepID=A0AA88VBG9_9ASTE|nr:hypothetical protein RJ639_017190 [Escallonia herrerae]
MATAAFRSSSRRGSPTPDNSSNSSKPNPERRRRSSSVSAVSRAQLHVPSEFSNKRENPLFWSSGSPPGRDAGFPDADVSSEFAESSSRVSGALTSRPEVAGQRGRPVARNPDGGSKKEMGRSLSRVDTGQRGRSVSRGPPLHRAHESEVEQDSVKLIKHRNRSDSNLISKNVNGDNLFCLQNQSWEDGVSTSSLSGAEEKTIKAVFEQIKSFEGDSLGGDTAVNGIYETIQTEVRRAISDIQNDLESAIRRRNATVLATADVTDIPPDLVNPGAVELVLDIRREYSRKLDESQERARKLRADLAVEEHRGQELSRILKETLPDPKTSSVQRSRLGRRTSSERKKMSKRLTEDAMSYFDECVSISTFDSSDFSAAEDPPLNSVGGTVTVGCISSLPQEGPGISASHGSSSCLGHKKDAVSHGRLTQSCRDSSLTANSSSNEPMINQGSRRGMNTERYRTFQFSLGQEPTENVGIQEEIRSYIKNFEKGVDKDDLNLKMVRSNCDLDGYVKGGRRESLLFDRIGYKNRIDTGSLHLCGGGFTISFLPSASII